MPTCSTRVSNDVDVFPCWLYYAHDLEKVARRAVIPLKDGRFCVGPDTRLPMWYGRRSQLDVDRGPCMPLSTFFLLRL